MITDIDAAIHLYEQMFFFFVFNKLYKMVIIRVFIYLFEYNF